LRIALKNREEFISTINNIIFNEVFSKGGSLYWGRELFIGCDGSDELCQKMIHTDKVMFVPSDDPIEHPGITMTYKNLSKLEYYEFRKSTRHL
jgi:hypothetical protein